MAYWSIGVLEWWSDGMLTHGVVEWWSTGVLESHSNKDKKISFLPPNPSLQVGRSP